MENMSKYQELALTYLTAVGLKILAAIIFWIVGRWLIGLVGRLLQQVLERQKVDPTLMRYIGNFLGVTLNIVLVVAILGYFGVETTTFAALIAGAGVAIGVAWSGMLSNLAAGVFMVVLRPFKVGDFVSAAGLIGTVKEIGLFTTSMNTPDNVLTIIGNGKIFADTIQNFSANAFRRVDLKCQLAGSADHVAAMQLLREKVAGLANVVRSPAVEVDILEFNLVGPVLAVRPYCHTDHYWQVYFDGNRVIKEALAAAGFPPPMPAQLVVVNQR
jgi:small conductance mechanosensitive channel